MMKEIKASGDKKPVFLKPGYDNISIDMVNQRLYVSEVKSVTH